MITSLARRILWKHPLLYSFVVKAKGRRSFYDESFDICLAGFPRSGNSYALRMIQVSQPGQTVQSHHHHPAVAIRALQRRKPVIFLLREPKEAIVSWSVHQSRSLEFVINYYCDFHNAIIDHLPRTVLVPFDKLTTDFRSVIEHTNRKFGTSLSTEFEEKATRDAAFKLITDNARGADGRVDHRRLHIPSVERDELKSQLLMVVEGPKFKASMGRAEQVYEQILRANRPSKSVG